MNEAHQPSDDSIDQTIGLGDQPVNEPDVQSADVETESQQKENKVKIAQMREALERGETTEDGTVYPPYNNLPRIIESGGLTMALATVRTMPGFPQNPTALLDHLDGDQDWGSGLTGEIKISRAVIEGIVREDIEQYFELAERMRTAEVATSDDVRRYGEYVAKVRSIGKSLLDQGFTLQEISK